MGRAEGLAIATLAMFCDGLFSSTPADPFRADAAKLQDLTDESLGSGFQASAENPLPGLPARADLLRRLGATVAARPDVFARDDTARPGGLFDHLAALSPDGWIPAATILSEVLRLLGPI